MVTKTIWQNIFFFFTALLLAGCGFHLRSNPPLPPNLHTIAVVSNQPYDKLTQNLTQIFKSMGLQVVPATSHPPITMVIDQSGFTETSYTQSSSSSTEQYIMYYSIVYHLADSKDTTIFGPKSLRLSQTYSLNQNQVLSTDNVQDTVQEQMQQDAVYRIISQLGSNEAQAALSKLGAPAKVSSPK